jgi:hypothetical protein
MGKFIATVNFELPQLKFKLNLSTGTELWSEIYEKNSAVSLQEFTLNLTRIYQVLNHELPA